MRVAFRCDSSDKIGSGHVMRCLALAGNLREKGAQVLFICSNIKGNLSWLIEERGYAVFLLSGKTEDTNWEADAVETSLLIERIGDFDWIIVDHYLLDARWEYYMRRHSPKIMVIDDLADRPHDCDLLLDQNYYKNPKKRYQGLVPDSCRQLLGPEYALLRPEFVETRRRIRARDGNVRRILVFFGGSDPTNETVKALESVSMLELDDIAVDVVVGKQNPSKEQVRELCRGLPNTTFYCQVDNMALLMAEADLSIGAGGTAMWERCFLGLPSIVVVVAENQLASSAAVADAGAIWLLGWHHDTGAGDILAAVRKALDNPSKLKEMGKKSTGLMSGRGVSGTDLVLKHIIGEC